MQAGRCCRPPITPVSARHVVLQRDAVYYASFSGVIVRLFRNLGRGNSCTRLTESWREMTRYGVIHLGRYARTRACRVDCSPDPDGRTREASDLCPLCKRRSRSVHSRYSRTLAGLSWCAATGSLFLRTAVTAFLHWTARLAHARPSLLTEGSTSTHHGTPGPGLAQDWGCDRQPGRFRACR
jgi:hypothetical protein